MRKLGYVFIVVFLLLAAALLAARLFFEETYNQYASQLLPPENLQSEESIDSLRLVGRYETFNFDLGTLDPNVRFPVSQIYEPLVMLDDNLAVKPSLALAWGEVKPTLWEFRLRKNVVFHDGSSFDANDVVSSFNSVMQSESDLKKLLSVVKEVKRVDDFNLQVSLFNEDPLFLPKFSYLLISPSEKKEHIGTGKFRFVSAQNDKLVLEAFAEFWDSASKVKNLEIWFEADADKRLDLLQTGEVDIAADLSLAAQETIDKNKFEVFSLPKLEMSFLVFNNSLIDSEAIKKALILSFDREDSLKKILSPARALYQFAPRGLLGFNPEIKALKPDIYEAKNILKNLDTSETDLTLHYLEGMDSVAEDFYSQWSSLGLKVTLKETSWQEMEKSLKQGSADLYLLSWKFDLPDISEFLKNFVHSFDKGREYGLFNVKNYRNVEADKLIEEILEEENVEQRVKKLREVMQIIVEEDPLGLALFELNTIYAHTNDLQISPRLDGTLNLANVNYKNS